MGRLRVFDHEEALRRHAAGESVAALATEYGVTPQAIYYVIALTDPMRRDGYLSYNRKWQRDRYRKPCVRGCGRLAWHQRGSEGVCRRCRNAERATTVRATELLCTRCGEWKVDDDFPGAANNVGRRGRHSLCRVCQTKARQDYRSRHKVSCVQCGAPCLPASEKGPRASDSRLCRPCWIESRRTQEVRAVA